MTPLKNLFLLSVLTVIILSCNSSKKTVGTDAYRLLFNGKDLDGWVYDPVYWRVEDSCLVGEVTPETILKRNTFIYLKDLETKDFDLKVDFRISAKGNSGINYRSELIDSLPYAMRGYQADIDGRNRYTGQNYEERKRTTLAYRGQATAVYGAPSIPEHVKSNAWTLTSVKDTLGNDDSIKAVINDGGWNEYHLIVKGNHLQHYVNGVLMSDVTDMDTTNRSFSGLLGVQVHVGPPMKVEYKNFRYKEL